MYLKRKADAYLNAWKSDPNRSPLIIKGPRQVGKTETIDYFAAHNYRSVVEINFVEEPKYRAITADGYGADTIVRNISLIDPAKKSFRAIRSSFSTKSRPILISPLH